jgi:DNA-binding transcriptional LysR family regulator
MDLRNLQHFVAVADTLNYSRAAERLNISPSPLSRSIQKLEVSVGGALFLRGTRRVELTPLGLSLLPYANKVLENVAELEREASRRVRGHVELYMGIRSVPPELTRALVDDVIKRAEPTAEVRLSPLDSFAQMDQILKGKLSLGLLNRRSDDHRLEYLPVLTEAAGMALPDEPRFAQLAEVTPDDVAGMRLLEQPGSDPRSPQIEEFRKVFREIMPVDTDIVGGISAMIAEGGACCLTLANPSAPWHHYLLGDGVVIRPLETRYEHPTTYLCWRTDRDNDDDLGAILKLARQRFASPLDL